MYRSGRIIFKKQGITLKIKMGVETFDDTFRREVFDKGMEGVMPEEIAGRVADEVCLLFGISGQTAESMQKDIEMGLKYFERICINIMVENTTPIRPDQGSDPTFLWNRFIRNIKKTKGWIFCFKIQILESEEKKRRRERENE